MPLQDADFDGDKRDDMVVWRPSDGTFYALLSRREFDRNNPLVRHWGTAGDKPLPGIDFNGDNMSDMVVWRPSDGTFYALLSDPALGFNTSLIRQWGVEGDIPLF